MKITVLGCGRWGSFIAWYLNKINHEVFLWGRSGSKKTHELIKDRKNNLLDFNKKVIISDDLEKSLNFSDIIVISISAQNLRAFLEELKCKNIKKKIIVLCMKGLEESSGKRLTEIVEETISPEIEPAVWVGPGHVQDFIKNIPNCMIIDSENNNIKHKLINLFSSSLIRLYYGTDLIGNEVGAATKNIMGIAAGILDGMGISSLKGALMSRGTREISKLIKTLGGKEISAYGLAHLGDYQATLFSLHSRNRSFGEMLINKKINNELCEGVSTAKAIEKLVKVYNLDLPICTAVNNIIQKKTDPKKELLELFSRSLKHEF